MMIEINQSAPDFELKDSGGNLHKLSDYRGHPLVLYFYPKDDTPGCTVEACEFRDDYSVYQDAGAKILGISPDDEKSHTIFKQKFDLPFTILADTDHTVSELYGVWAEKNMYGRKYFGIKRTTFLIDSYGKILRIFENVKPKGHSTEVLAALK